MAPRFFLATLVGGLALANSQAPYNSPYHTNPVPVYVTPQPTTPKMPPPGQLPQCEDHACKNSTECTSLNGVKCSGCTLGFCKADACGLPCKTDSFCKASSTYCHYCSGGICGGCRRALCHTVEDCPKSCSFGHCNLYPGQNYGDCGYPIPLPPPRGGKKEEVSVN